MRSVRVEMFCVDVASNKQRRYLVLLRSPEEGEGFYEVISRWGRIGESLSERVERFQDAEMALKHVKSILRLRVQHGYALARVDPKNHPLGEWLHAESFPFEPLPYSQRTLFEDFPPPEGDDEQLTLFDV